VPDGQIGSDQTWGPDGSPYVVDGTVQVGAGTTLRILPGTVVKFVPTKEHNPANLNLSRISVWGGRLVADGTEADPIVFTSVHDDTVGGDTDGSGPAPARGDWLDIRFSSPKAVETETPVSVIDNARFRYGGEGSGGTYCTGGRVIDVTSNGRVRVSRSEFTDAEFGAVSFAALKPGVGVASLTSSRIADSGCGGQLNGGDVVGNVFDASLDYRSLQSVWPQNLRMYGNWLYDEPWVQGGTELGREQADVRNNALLGGFSNAPGTDHDHRDLAYNWWGPNPSQPTGCYDFDTTYIPDVTLGGSACTDIGKLTIAGYFTKVTPMLASAPPLPQVGIGADPSAPTPVPDGQTYGVAWRGSEYAYRPAGTQSDPVSSATGSFVATETDAAVAAVGVPLVATRTYNSADTAVGWLGKGWSFGYQVTLTESGDGSTVVFRAGDGQRVSYGRQPDGSYLGAPGATADLHRNAEGSWQLTTRGQLRHTFNPSGRLLSVLDRNGQGVRFGYDADSRLTTASNGTRSLRFTHNGTGDRITGIELPDGRTVGFGYTDGLLTSVTDPAGATTTYGYDGQGRLTTVTSPTGTRVLRNAYNPATGRVSDQWDGLDHHTGFGWDPGTQTATMTDPRGGQWVDRYQGNVLLARTTPAGATTTFEYDARLQLIASDSPRGFRSVFGYNQAGDLTSFSGPAGSVHTGYDTGHNATHSVNGRGVRVDYRYDQRGNLIGVDRPDPADPDATVSTGYGYDPRGLLTEVTDPRGKTTSYTHDADGDLVSVRSPGGSVTTLGHDQAGRLTMSVDPRGNQPGQEPADYTTRLSYTGTDQPATLTGPLGHTTRWSYRPDGLPDTVTDAKDRVTTYRYDDAGRLLSVQGPDPMVPATRYSYDANGNLATLTDPNDRVTSYSYDLANRPTESVSPLGRYRYGYDRAGNLTKVTDPTGKTTTLVHDSADRLIGIDYPTGATDVTYRYDPNGNRAAMTDAAGTVTYRYDTLDQLTSVTRGAQVFRYGYDPAGAITGLTYPDGTSYQYGYDIDHRLDTVTSGATTLADYGYDPAGRLASITRGNGTYTTLEHDPAGRLTRLTDTRPSGGVLLEETYRYDPAGNLTQATDASGDTTTHQYDTLDRLTATCYHTTTCQTATDFIRWAYDPVGNRTSETRLAGTTSYGYHPVTGLLETVTAPAGSTSYGYDPLGQLKTVTGPGTTASYTYNTAGRVTSSTSNGVTNSYTYDGDGRRLSATTGADRTNYAWLPIGYQLAAETTGDGTPIRRYSYGAGRIGVATPGGGQGYYHTDPQGSVRAVTDTGGDPQWSYQWEPYGLNRATTQHTPTAPANPVGWAGQYTDPNGNSHLRARQYDPVTGRFTSPDPAAAVTAASTFVYANANPNTYADPYGLWPSWPPTWDDITNIAPTVAVIAGTLALIPPAAPLFGPIAVAAGAITAYDSAVTAYHTCTGTTKGSCAGAVVTATLNTSIAIPGAGWGGYGLKTWWGLRAHAVAKTADDWPIISGIVRDASKGKGNFGLGAGTRAQADDAGRAWVGDGFTVASDGKTLVSADGLRQYRPPSYKPNLDMWQANFEQRLIPRGTWQGNGHLDILDP
jgi:RHS repeat-associated protein